METHFLSFYSILVAWVRVMDLKMLCS